MRCIRFEKNFGEIDGEIQKYILGKVRKILFKNLIHPIYKLNEKVLEKNYEDSSVLNIRFSELLVFWTLFSDTTVRKFN